jgi:hypothetical protein
VQRHLELDVPQQQQQQQQKLQLPTDGGVAAATGTAAASHGIGGAPARSSGHVCALVSIEGVSFIRSGRGRRRRLALKVLPVGSRICIGG